MEDIRYKEYTKEESRIYDSAMEKLNKSIAQGLNFNDAVSRLDIADEELKRFITDDFLKIFIAQLHYEKGLPLKDVASAMSIPYERVMEAHKAMLQDVQITSIAEYHKGLSKGQA
ncbi:hypothetical protein [Candidatus Magnetominusculus xianensis]|uniref:Uncharacterized protein n=1 Tax=Candidatus Magnetominusculus xianensis TaxID=1748249 RepID=A0ABR5SJQ0_9BACT|nr:hypothetical protein [Candidatus Magnetominusculus xianensis]KWT91692.1 hypothetical protein ASN18_0810 [Candidatus Magnetominusculus xianensis]MBF0404552.1 hypothetical protein [Nitrospirota bacterium]